MPPINRRSILRYAGIGIGSFATGYLTNNAAPQISLPADLEERGVSLLAVAPDLSDGANAGPAIELAASRAKALGKPLILPPHPRGKKWRIASSIKVPGDTEIIGLGAKAECLTNTDLFVSTESRFRLRDLAIDHAGEGKIFNLAVGSGHEITGCQLGASRRTAVEPLIYDAGSNVYVDNVLINNFRNGAYARVVERIADQICINSRMTGCYFGGPGKLLKITTAVPGARPEGFLLDAPRSVLTGSDVVRIEAVLSMTISKPMLDQPSGACVLFAPSDIGIEGFECAGGYVSAATGGSAGAAFRYTGGSLTDVKIAGVQIYHSGYGLDFVDGSSNVKILDNTFAHIGTRAIKYKGSGYEQSGNAFFDVAANMILDEGRFGGSLHVGDDDRYEDGKDITILQVDKSKWFFGYSSGRFLRSITSNTKAVNSGRTTDIAIPHKLIGPPNPAKITVSATAESGGFNPLSAWVSSVDGTNVFVSLSYGLVSPGTIRVNVDASI